MTLDLASSACAASPCGWRAGVAIPSAPLAGRVMIRHLDAYPTACVHWPHVRSTARGVLLARCLRTLHTRQRQQLLTHDPQLELDECAAGVNRSVCSRRRPAPAGKIANINSKFGKFAASRKGLPRIRPAPAIHSCGVYEAYATGMVG